MKKFIILLLLVLSLLVWTKGFSDNIYMRERPDGSIYWHDYSGNYGIIRPLDPERSFWLDRYGNHGVIFHRDYFDEDLEIDSPYRKDILLPDPLDGEFWDE